MRKRFGEAATYRNESSWLLAVSSRDPSERSSLCPPQPSRAGIFSKEQCPPRHDRMSLWNQVSWCLLGLDFEADPGTGIVRCHMPPGASQSHIHLVSSVLPPTRLHLSPEV